MYDFAAIPMQWIGPIMFSLSKSSGNACSINSADKGHDKSSSLKDKCNSDNLEQVNVPLATYESPLWPSTNRGAKVTRESGGITLAIMQDFMTRSIVLEAGTAADAINVCHDLQRRLPDLAEVVGQTSAFAKLEKLDTQVNGLLKIY